MTFFTDNHFVIGANHVAAGTPCQDYASSGVESGVAFAIVSDGCSTGKRTDVGSRLMVLTTQTAIIDYRPAAELVSALREPGEINLAQRLLLNGIKQTLGLTRQDLLATCTFAYLTTEGGFIHIRGDGVVARMYRDGRLILNRYDWALNLPFYPIYNDEGLNVYIARQGGNIDAPVLTEVTRTYIPSGGCTEETTLHTLADGIMGLTIPISENEVVNELAFVAVYTDGVTQVEGLEWHEAARDLLAFKTLDGEFATRRMIRFLKNAQPLGKGPLDDLAYAVIQLRPED